MEGEGPQTRSEGEYSSKSVGAGRLCDDRSVNDSTRAGGVDVECAYMGRMVDWHVIQERLEPGERWYGDRLVLDDTCVQRESECGSGWGCQRRRGCEGKDGCERTLYTAGRHRMRL